MPSTNVSQLSSEQQALLSSIRPQEGGEDLFWERMAYDLDWPALFNLAVHHNVLALVYRRLRDLRLIGLDTVIIQHFKQASLTHALRNQRLAGRLLDALDLFSMLGIHAVPFKGPALAIQAYGDLALRQFLDLDILVQRADFERAAHALIQAGWRPELDLAPLQVRWHMRSAYHLRFERQGDLLELHWRVGEPSHTYPLPEKLFWQDVEMISLLDRPAPAFSPANSLLAVCIHGASNQWQKLKWIADVAWLVQSHPDLDLQSLLGEARRLGFQRVLLSGLGLAQKFAGLANLPPVVQAQIERDHNVQGLITHVSDNSIARTQSLGMLPNNMFYLRSREWLKSRMFYVYDEGFVPKYADWSAIPLPAGLYPLYYILRPVRLLLKFAPQLINTAAERSQAGRAVNHGVRT